MFSYFFVTFYIQKDLHMDPRCRAKISDLISIWTEFKMFFKNYGNNQFVTINFLDAFWHLYKRVCPSVRPSSTSWNSEERAEFERNSTGNMELCHLKEDSETNTRQIARTHLMSELCQTHYILEKTPISAKAAAPKHAKNVRLSFPFIFFSWTSLTTILFF